jgi:phytoene desaturase
MARHVVIIGGGVGGLAAAIRLAGRGVRVTLVEKGPRVGGKLNFFQASHPDRPHDRPFNFDTGPSLLTLPFVFKDLFEAVGEDVRDHLKIHKLDPVSRFVWADGRTLELSSDEAQMRDAIARFAPGDVAGWQRFLERGRHIWDLAGEFFLMNAPEQILNAPGTTAADGLRMASIPFRIGMFRKYARAVDGCVSNQRLREVLYQYATYSGASPFLAPATLNVIPYCELHFGGWYIEGGMYQLARSLESLALKLGVDVRVNTSAKRIVTQALDTPQQGRRAWRARHVREVRAVELHEGSRLNCDAVICNADVVWAYEHLIDVADRPHRTDASLKKLEPGGSGMALMLGVEGTYPQLAHHTKFMPDDYRSDLNAMFESKTLPADPCIYVCASTRSDRTQAPEGCENLFVLTSAPALDGVLDWDVEGPRYERQVIDTLETRFGLAELSKRIVVRHRITPADLASRYNAHRGSIYGISSNGLKAAFLRPANRDKDVRGLYFAGGATHPGGGLPLVTLSAKIATQMLFDDLAPAT